MIWSQYQNDLFDAVTSGRDVELEAVAGSGKSTTIFEVMRRSKKASLYLAFNKSVQEHAMSKVGKNPACTIKTLNAFGLQIIRAALNPKAQVEPRKIFNYLSKNKDIANKPTLAAFIAKARRLNVDPKNYEGLISQIANLTAQNEIREKLDFITKANHDLDHDTKTIDFDDMLRFPYIYNLVPKMNISNKIVLLDEAHDVNLYQVDMMAKLQKLGNQIVYVGDRSQAIYGFRGALSNSMDKLRQAVNPSLLTLPITYRCKSVISDYVNRNLRPYTAMISSTHGGEISNVYFHDVARFVIDHDVRMIVSPKNVNLIKLWIQLATEGQQSSLKGSKIIDALKAHIEPYKKLSSEQYYNKIKDVDEEKAGVYITEIIEGTLTIINEYGIDYIQDLYTVFELMDSGSIVNLHTVHSSKGLESSKVMVVNDWFPNDQLRNMKYVAATRPMDHLIFADIEKSNKSSDSDE